MVLLSRGFSLSSESKLSSMKQGFEINNTYYHEYLSEGNLSGKGIFHALFEENPFNSSFRDLFSSEIDLSLDLYDSIWLKLITILVYIVEVVSSMVMVAFVTYETQGYAGHYRTLINQLLSYLYGAVSYKYVYPNQSKLNNIFIIFHKLK